MAFQICAERNVPLTLAAEFFFSSNIDMATAYNQTEKLTHLLSNFPPLSFMFWKKNKAWLNNDNGGVLCLSFSFHQFRIDSCYFAAAFLHYVTLQSSNLADFLIPTYTYPTY